MTSFHLNIVCFDIPFPANYGGVIDVFYRIKALHDIGVKIHLHCFEYGRQMSQQLESLCTEVFLYKRKTKINKQLNALPYIVKSRDSKRLLDNLLKNEHPILFEGLHTCYFLGDSHLSSRVKAVRMHNIEHRYYAQLANSESHWIKRNYYKLESSKLKSYQAVLNYSNKVFAISEFECNYFKQQGFDSEYLPAFIEPMKVKLDIEQKPYAIYHGNLEVPENNRAAIFLLEVFNKLNYKLLIAGRNPSQDLIDRIKSLSNIELVSNPTETELNTLLRQASVHCLATFQMTGIKLKLIKSLFMPAFIVANSQMLEGTNLSSFCIEANTLDEWRTKIQDCFNRKIHKQDYHSRINEIRKMHDNSENAKRLVESLASVQL